MNVIEGLINQNCAGRLHHLKQFVFLVLPLKTILLFYLDEHGACSLA